MTLLGRCYHCPGTSESNLGWQVRTGLCQVEFCHLWRERHYRKSQQCPPVICPEIHHHITLSSYPGSKKCWEESPRLLLAGRNSTPSIPRSEIAKLPLHTGFHRECLQQGPCSPLGLIRGAHPSRCAHKGGGFLVLKAGPPPMGLWVPFMIPSSRVFSDTAVWC